VNDLNALAILYDRGLIATPPCLTTDAPKVPECREGECSRPPYERGLCKFHFDVFCYRVGKIGQPKPPKFIGEDVKEACRWSP
jgi:hypothetical protein